MGQDALAPSCLIESTNTMACSLVEVIASTGTVLNSGAASVRLDMPKNTAIAKTSAPLLIFKRLLI